MCNKVLALSFFFATCGGIIGCVAVIAVACNAEGIVKAIKLWRKGDDE